MTEPCELKIDLRSFGEMHFEFHSVLHNDDIHAVNTELAPDTVKPVSGGAAELDGGFATVTLPALSWNVIRFSK